jgi:uncharacterized cupin superfamily protein
VEVFNLFDAELADADAGDKPAGFGARQAELGPLLGGAQIGMSLYEIPPGERTWPYHYELAEEEWLLVVAGEPTLREPAGERRLRAGDVVAFPTGPEGAHQLRNETGEPVRVALVSANAGAVDATVYPDSDKAKIRGRDTRRMLRLSPGLDYWDGEA